MWTEVTGELNATPILILLRFTCSPSACVTFDAVLFPYLNSFSESILGVTRAGSVPGRPTLLKAALRRLSFAVWLC